MGNLQMLALALAIFATSCSGENFDDLLDRSSVLEIADASELESHIPYGVGAFKLKKEMHHGNGCLERNGRFFVLVYLYSDKELGDEMLSQYDQVFVAMDEWAKPNGERPVKAWIDGMFYDLSSMGLGADGSVTANEFTEFCNSYAEQSRLAASALAESE